MPHFARWLTRRFVPVLSLMVLVMAVAAPAWAGEAHDVQGVRFTAPEAWAVTAKSSGSLTLRSPDKQYTVLAFWWFPDEPLLGYDDITNVEHIVIDHEPVTLITSEIGGRVAVKGVTERARADKKRFIFTVEGEGEGVEAQAVRAEYDTLAATLRFAEGFAGAIPARH